MIRRIKRLLSEKLQYKKYINQLEQYHINILNTEDTLNIIKNNKISVARLGDGEFNLILNNSIGFQKKDSKMTKDLKRVLSDKDKNGNCLVCIPYSYSSLEPFNGDSRYFWSTYWNKNKSIIYPLLSKEYQYGDSQCSRIYVNRENKNDSTHYFSIWKKIWKDEDLLIVEGSKTRFGVGNTLFETTNSLKRIICPSENAYSKYDEIYNSIIELGRDKLIVLALGPTATILSYDLSKNGYWALDIGNLDMEYEWSLINATSKVAIKGKYTTEVKGGTNVESIHDEEYEKQIIKVID